MQETTQARKSIFALLVDDDVAYLEVLKFFLEREGSIECETADSARRALEILSDREFDAIVSDYLMPDMDGLELLKIVRLQGKEVPFIMLTGRGREDVAIEALNSGADFYVQKGGDPKAQYTDLSNMIKKATRQRLAERGARESERFLSTIIESVQDGVSILNRDMVIEKVNPAMERWYADSMPLVGRKCHDAYHGKSEPCDVCPVRDALRTGRMSRARVVKEGVGGKGVGWLDVVSLPVKDEQTGEVVRVIEYLRDVTDEEAARLALESSERKYRAITDLASEGVLAIGSGGEIALVNPKIAQMLGYSPEELIGTQIGSLVDRGWLVSMGPDRLHKILEDGERIEVVLRRKDGSQVPVMIAAAPVSSERGMFGGAVAVVTDITDLGDVMEGMISAEEKFARIFETSPQMIMIARASDCAVLEVNEAFSKALGYTKDQLIGRSYLELGIISDALASKLEQLLEENGMVFDFEATMGTSSGGERIVRLSSYRLSLQGQECTVMLSCDLTSGGVGVRELRQERDVLKTILESTPDGIIITDLKGMIVESNVAMCAMLGGITKEEIIGKDIFSMVGSDEASLVRRLNEKLMREGAFQGITLSMARKDSIIIRAEMSAALVKDSLGKPLYQVCVFRDVTDQVRYRATLERALEERRQMESIIDSGPAVAIRWREELGWPVDYVSTNIRQFGYEAASLMSGAADFISMIHPDDRDRVIEEAEKYLEEGRREFEQEYRIVSPEGTSYWVYDMTTALRRQDGSVMACQGVVVDVTKMREALERLSRAERQLKLFMDLSPVIKFMKNRAGRYVYVNMKHRELFGAASGDWIGKTDHDLFPKEVADHLVESDKKVFETGSFHSFVETIPLEDGQHEYLTYKFIVPNISGGEDMLAGVAVDMTDERRYERALRSANEKLNLLGDMTRHDIANQLSVLTGWLDLLRESELDPGKLKRIDDMRRASETIHELLVFASEYQDIGAQKPGWSDVERAVEEGVAGLPMEGVRVELEVGGLEVYADPMLARVFRNLVDNSLRHGKRVSVIRMTGHGDGEELVLVYEDDGVGVPEEVKERIFERGFGQHTGLGLFMVREILGLTGATIREVGKEGSGARFEVRIPSGNFRLSTDKD